MSLPYGLSLEAEIATGSWQLAAGTHIPLACFKYPSLQKHPITQFLVQIGLGCGLSQVAGHAVPQVLNTSFSLQTGGIIIKLSALIFGHCSFLMHLPLVSRTWPSLQAHPWTQILGQIGCGFVHVASQPLH